MPVSLIRYRMVPMPALGGFKIFMQQASTAFGVLELSIRFIYGSAGDKYASQYRTLMLPVATAWLQWPKMVAIANASPLDLLIRQ